MIRSLIKVFLIVVISSVCLGAGEAEPSPIKIQSNNMKYFGKEKKSIFIGDVLAYNDEFNLTADNVTVYFSDNSSIEMIFCVGNVNFKTQDIISLSRKADVDEVKKIAILTGNVKVWQQDNFLEGERAVIYYKEDRIEVDKGKESQVMIIFKPDDKNKQDNSSTANKDNATKSKQDNKSAINKSITKQNQPKPSETKVR